jgi:hypothetical protein
VRRTLLDALLGFADKSRRSGAHRFLTGLSADELQFIAGFLGACVLESAAEGPRSHAELDDTLMDFPASGRCRTTPSYDQEHKMILLLEYLRRSGIRQVSRVSRSGASSD